VLESILSFFAIIARRKRWMDHTVRRSASGQVTIAVRALDHSCVGNRKLKVRVTRAAENKIKLCQNDAWRREVFRKHRTRRDR
jgi:hypothetical protein